MKTIDEFISEEQELYDLMIDRYEKLDVNGCRVRAEEHKQLIEWLEELKSIKDSSAKIYESGYKRGYNEAINKFAERMKQMCKGIAIAENYIDELVEQMKRR